MSDVSEVTTTSSTELLASGRRHLAVRDYSSAVETLAKACEVIAKEHGDTADQCAEVYLWYGKALLGLSREESGVLGDGMPGTNNADEEDEDNEEQEENGENEAVEEQNGEAEAEAEPSKENGEPSSSGVETIEPESTTNDEPGSSAENEGEPGPSNGDAGDESMMDAEDDVDNLQLAWEMLDLARSIVVRREAEGGGVAARALLADIHLALGEVALESETYDKAVIDMQSCLDLQKDLYGADDRRIAETHYQIGLANSLASNFEDAVTHFKNAVNILESRIKTLESPSAATEDATVKKYTTADPFYSIEGEIKELKELLPEIQEKIQDMMDYKAETIKRVRESLCPSIGEGSSQNGASSSSSQPKPAASDISHLIKRKRKASDADADSSNAKRVNT